MIGDRSPSGGEANTCGLGMDTAEFSECTPVIIFLEASALAALEGLLTVVVHAEPATD